MPYCCVPECTNSKVKDSSLSFYYFPKIEPFRSQWIKAIRRADWEPTPASVICSWHFPRGREMGPIRFAWNCEKYFDFPDPSPKRIKKARKIVENDANNSFQEHDIQEPAVRNQCVQTEFINEFSKLNETISALQIQLDHANMRTKFANISQNPAMVVQYTSLKIDAFQFLVKVLKRKKINYYQSWCPKMEMEDQLLLTLMKIYRNFTHIDLAHRFNISQTYVTNVFLSITYCFHMSLFLPMLQHIPDLKKCQQSMPACFSDYPNCRFVWDCCDIFIERPGNDLTAQKTTYSHYRGGNTFKALVSIAPNGTIVYVSPLFTGCTSDKQIVQKSGILNILIAGDLIMADKGFLISNILPPGVVCNIPPFLDSTSQQFTPYQVMQTRKIARARIHVERAIQRIKEMSILDCLPHQYRNHSDIIFQVATLIVNLQTPIIANQ